MALEARGGADPTRSRSVELEEYRKDGTTVWTEVSLSFIRDEERRPVGILTVSRDITERKRAEEKIQASLKEKEALLREIHHRVKNNMQIISSLINISARRINDPACSSRCCGRSGGGSGHRHGPRQAVSIAGPGPDRYRRFPPRPAHPLRPDVLRGLEPHPIRPELETSASSRRDGGPHRPDRRGADRQRHAARLSRRAAGRLDHRAAAPTRTAKAS